MVNPFVIGRYAGPEYFCDRVSETQTLIHHLVNGRDVALISPRRIGKSGLIEHTFCQPVISDNYHCFYIDIYGTRSFSEFIYQFGKGIFSQLKPNENRLRDRFLQVVRSLQMGVGFDPVSFLPTFDLKLGAVDVPMTTLEEIFEYLNTADKPCIVAFDEFQQIAEYTDGQLVEAQLRAKIQQCNNVRFIFSGSKRHLMTRMFLSPAKPFYQSTITMGLAPIPLEAYTDFAVGHFARNKRNIDAGVVEEVYRMFDGTSWFVQMMMNELYAATSPGETCSSEMLDEAYQSIIQSQTYSYQELMERIPTRQKEVLIAIAKEGQAVGVNSGTFIKKHHLHSSSSVQSSLRALLNEDIVTMQDGVYRVYDYFFAYWLRSNY